MSGIPFQLPDIGPREIHGTIYLDDEFLVFEVEDAFIGEFDKEHMVIKVEPAALKDIRLDRGIIRDRLYIQPKKRDLLTVMPGTYGEALPLKMWNTQRRRAERLVEAVRRRMKSQRAPALHRDVSW